MLTEVVIEVAHPDYPMCRFTRENAGVKCVYRVVDTGGSSGVFRATLTVIAPADVSAGFVKELRATRSYDEFEIASVTPYAMILRLGHRIPDARNLAGIGVQPVEKFLEVFGVDTVLEPFLCESGKIRVRAMIPQPMDTKQVLIKLQEVQRAMTWEHFRVIRVSEFKATKYADILRRMLAPDQEDLLRLALSLGYYASPKKCTLEDIAQRVGLSVSPVHKKLKAIEQTLINAFIDPSTITAPDMRPRRGRGLPLSLNNSQGLSFAEIGLRVSWPGFQPVAFTARTPGARVIFQPLVEDARAGVSSALMVAVAPAPALKQLVEGYERHPAVRDLEIVSRDDEHVSLKLKSALGGDLSSPAGASAGKDQPNPFPVLMRRFGRGDAYLKPVIIEGDDVWIRIVVLREIPMDDLQARLEPAAQESGWTSWEIASLRRLDVEQASGPLPQTEKVTPRQEEVLKIAHALGYYKTPRECTLEQVAKTLGISANAIHKNLTAAEQKIITNYLSASG